jgi:hypothetical protein
MVSIPKIFFHCLKTIKDNIDASEVNQFQRTHWEVAADLQRLVDFPDAKTGGPLSAVSESESHRVGCALFPEALAQTYERTCVLAVGLGNDP